MCFDNVGAKLFLDVGELRNCIPAMKNQSHSSAPFSTRKRNRWRESSGISPSDQTEYAQLAEIDRPGIEEHDFQTEDQNFITWRPGKNFYRETNARVASRRVAGLETGRLGRVGGLRPNFGRYQKQRHNHYRGYRENTITSGK